MSNEIEITRLLQKKRDFGLTAAEELALGELIKSRPVKVEPDEFLVEAAMGAIVAEVEAEIASKI